MTRLDELRTAGARTTRGDVPRGRFGAVLLAAVGIPTAALYLVPQPVLAGLELPATLVAVIGGGAAVGAACGIVLRSASRRDPDADARGATGYLLAAGLCFVALCVTALAAVLIGTGAWYRFRDVQPRALLLTAVAGGALLLGVVFAVSGAVLLPMRGVRSRLAWAETDLAVQVFGLGAVLAVAAILY